MIPLYPLRFEEIPKEKIWGGRTLGELLGKRLAPDVLIGESWEVSDRDGDQSIVAEGTLKGTSLGELVRRYGSRLVGDCSLAKGRFPLLLKIIDAQQKLSVQVHPTDELALKYGEMDPGKTEMWYVVAAQPGAELMLGLRPDVTKQDFLEAIRAGRFEGCLDRFRVQTGDAFFLPAGSVHALGAGIVVAEIQENSDATYRLYDWGRVGADGKPRAVHLEKALDAINFDRPLLRRVSGVTSVEGENRRTLLVACTYFAAEAIEVKSEYREETNGNSFSILFFERADPFIVWNGETLRGHRGQSWLIPAEIRSWRIEGTCKVLRFYVPDIVKDIIEPLTERGIAERDIRLLGGDLKTGDVARAYEKWLSAREQRETKDTSVIGKCSRTCRK
jgi:mannose-6-phosphate isomerase